MRPPSISLSSNCAVKASILNWWEYGGDTISTHVHFLWALNDEAAATLLMGVLIHSLSNECLWAPREPLIHINIYLLLLGVLFLFSIRGGAWNISPQKRPPSSNSFCLHGLISARLLLGDLWSLFLGRSERFNLSEHHVWVRPWIILCCSSSLFFVPRAWQPPPSFLPAFLSLFFRLQSWN